MIIGEKLDKMGKRSNFERIERDFYPTPEEALIPLLPHLPKTGYFTDPCAGDGALIDHLERLTDLKCSLASDIEPQREDIYEMDALIPRTYYSGDFIITNPPWNRKILHPLIEIFARQKPTWLLFDADWVHTKQSISFLPMLKQIISIGRIKWIPGSKSTGKDNCCWYLFMNEESLNIDFYGRRKK